MWNSPDRSAFRCATLLVPSRQRSWSQATRSAASITAAIHASLAVNFENGKRQSPESFKRWMWALT